MLLSSKQGPGHNEQVLGNQKPDREGGFVETLPGAVYHTLLPR